MPHRGLTGEASWSAWLRARHPTVGGYRYTLHADAPEAVRHLEIICDGTSPAEAQAHECGSLDDKAVLLKHSCHLRRPLPGPPEHANKGLPVFEHMPPVNTILQIITRLHTIPRAGVKESAGCLFRNITGLFRICAWPSRHIIEQHGSIWN